MKKVFLTLSLLACVTYSMLSQSFYYCKGKQYPITESLENVSIVLPKKDPNLNIVPLELTPSEKIEGSNYVIYVCAVQNKNSAVPDFAPSLKGMLKKRGGIILPCFTDAVGENIVVAPDILVKLKNESDVGLLQTIAKQYKLEKIDQDPYMPLWYSLHISPLTEENPLDIANAIYETGKFAASEPNFCIFQPEISYDPYVCRQWGICNFANPEADISISSAWNYATGIGTKIAIVDKQAVDPNHEDLGHIICLTDSGEGDLPIGDHATSCAGIAAAKRNNGLGVAGIAPDAQLMSAYGKTMKDIARCINQAWTNGADVISISVGRRKLYPGENLELKGEMLLDAIEAAILRGRNGLGCIVVKSAGNEWEENSITFPGDVAPNILVVGAICSNGERWEGSSFGPTLSVMAPGVDVFTTFAGGQYDIQSPGTSFAAPHVAGLAALILERNPFLTSRQVRDLIEQNSRKIGTRPYETYKTNGSWNVEYGYGLIDAFQTIRNTPIPVQY